MTVHLEGFKFMVHCFLTILIFPVARLRFIVLLFFFSDFFFVLVHNFTTVHSSEKISSVSSSKESILLWFL